MATLLDELVAQAVSATQSLAAGRVFKNTPPANYRYAGPYIVVRRVGDRSASDITAKRVGLGFTRVEFSCRARHDNETQQQDGGIETCEAMAQQLADRFNGYSSALIQAIVASDLRGLDLWDEDERIHIYPIDFDLDITETAP